MKLIENRTLRLSLFAESMKLAENITESVFQEFRDAGKRGQGHTIFWDELTPNQQRRCNLAELLSMRADRRLNTDNLQIAKRINTEIAELRAKAYAGERICGMLASKVGRAG
jgi:hypothetical protein